MSQHIDHPLKLKRGFTLIEILVVLSVIGILAALLFPVFSKAREGGRRTHCLGNLSQIGLATQLYMQDNDWYYPSPFPPGLNCTWINRLESYTKSTAIFECPSDPKGEFRTGCPAPEVFNGDEMRYQGSYSMNVLDLVTMKLKDIQLSHPSSTILVVDGTRDKIISSWTNPSPKDLIESDVAPRHQDGANVLMADGHVKWLKLEAMTNINLWKLAASD